MQYQEKEMEQLKRINENNDYEELNDRYIELVAENRLLKQKLE